MKTKIIDGKECILRDVIYSDFGAETETEKKVALIRSSETFRSQEARKNLFKDVNYSWSGNDYEYETDVKISEGKESSYSTEEPGEGFEERDTEYSGGNLTMRLVVLKRPLHMQLKYLHRDHMRFYKSRVASLKPAEIDLLIEDFRYELHRIIAKAKDMIVSPGGSGNMDTLLKVGSIGGGPELQKTLRGLTILFKRVQQAFDQYGSIPRMYQIKLNDSLSILISHFILDVYGDELEKRKVRESELSKDNKS